MNKEENQKTRVILNPTREFNSYLAGCLCFSCDLNDASAGRLGGVDAASAYAVLAVTAAAARQPRPRRVGASTVVNVTVRQCAACTARRRRNVVVFVGLSPTSTVSPKVAGSTVKAAACRQP